MVLSITSAQEAKVTGFKTSGGRNILNKKEYEKESNIAELRGVPRGYVVFKAKNSAIQELSPEAQELFDKAIKAAKDMGHKEVTPAHIIYAAIEQTEENLINVDKDLLESGAVESISTLNKIVNTTVNKSMLGSLHSIEFFLESIQHLKEDNNAYLEQLPKSNGKVETVTISKVLSKSLSEAQEKMGKLDAYSFLGVSMNTLLQDNITYTSDFLKDLLSYNRYKEVGEVSPSYMPLYDSRAIEVWNKLALGSNLSVTYSNPKEAERITASILTTMDDPKYGNFNSENTEVFPMSSKIKDTDLYEEVMQQKSMYPDKQKIFLVDLDSLLVNSQQENGEINYSNGIMQAIAATDDNLKIIFFQSNDVFYNIAKEPSLKAVFKNFVTYPIPPIQTYETMALIGGGKKALQGIVSTPFTKDARERAIHYAANMSGIFPDKAIDLMKRISKYYGTSKKKITAKDVDEFAQIAHELFARDEKTNIIYDTGKTLSSMYGKETVKKDIEAIVRQIKTGKIGTQGIIIYSQDVEAGSGRRYTAETIAGEARVPFLAINSADFAVYERDEEGSIVDTPKNAMSRMVSEIKKAARQNQYKTAIMYINNFEDFAFSDYIPGYKQAMSQLAEEMKKAEAEDVNIIVIGSTDERYAEYIPMYVRGFNKRLTVDSPAFNNKARKEILENRIKECGLPLSYRTRADKEYMLSKLVKITEWMSFVEIKSLVDKTKQIMYERNKKKATIGDFIEAYLQIATGRTSHPEMPEYNKQATTSHECGHATNLEVMNDIFERKGKPWHKFNNVNFITLDPRGNFLGAVFEGRDENRDYPFEAMFTGLVCSYGGYSCEKMFFDMDGSAGISQDLAQATAEAKRGVEHYGLGFHTGKISGAVDLSSNKFQEVIFRDVEIMLKNAQMASDLITECYKGFNEWFTNKFSKLIGTDDCMIDGDDFRKYLAQWKKSLSASERENIEIMDDIIMDIIKYTKKGELYSSLKKAVK